MGGINLGVEFAEEGSAAIGFSFKGLDAPAENVTPNTFLWTLTDANGTVINSREDVAESTASTVWVLLKGDDLVYFLNGTEKRIITVKGTYNSILGGVVKTNVPYTGEFEFKVLNFTNIS